MNFIGVCSSNGDLYEGSPGSGLPFSSSVALLPVRFTSDGSDTKETLGGYPQSIFKEDFFDPITKIRRGRIFNAESTQPRNWYVHHPARQDLRKVDCRYGTAQQIELITYQKDPLNNLRHSNVYPDLIIGKEPFVSIWKIISIETSFSGTPVLTLKSYRSFGAIPDLIPNAIPETARSKLIAALDKVENSSNRLGPTDVVDRCRDALSIVFAHLIDEPDKDLSKSINSYVVKFNSSKDNLVSWAGKIVARLHSRGKPNEQVKQGVDDLGEEDAQIALKCLWLIFVEIGWAKSRTAI